MKMILQDYKNLVVKGRPEVLSAFLLAVEEALTDGWRRDRELEKNISANDMTCFSCEEAPGRRAAALWLAERHPGELYVSNIVPLKQSQLDYDEYNFILTDFEHKIARPAAIKIHANLTVGGGGFELKDFLTNRALAAFELFSSSANRATGASHPLDQERWFEFVVAAHLDQCQLSTHDLERWLLEAEEWDEEEASILARDYGQQRDLLSFYDRGR